MSALTERFEIRLRPQSLRLLRQEAERRGVSVAEAVRQAIDLWLEQDQQARRQAAEALFQVGAPVDDWEQMKEEIIQARTAAGTG
jgi:Arc/MetJ-type ribon-helix-helix transcriptional regulator